MSKPPNSTNLSNNPATPYLNARREWDERYGDALSHARSWRFAALASIAVAGLAVAGVSYIGAQSKIQPFVVAIDQMGSPVAIAQPTGGSAVSQRILIAQIANWIWNARTQLSDPAAQKVLIDQVYALSSADTGKYLNGYYKAHSPFTDDGSVVRVNVTSALPVSENTYQVTWVESRAQPGQTVTTQNWKANLTLGIDPKLADKPQVALANPLGIFIKSLTWTQVLN